VQSDTESYDFVGCAVASRVSAFRERHYVAGQGLPSPTFPVQGGGCPLKTGYRPPKTRIRSDLHPRSSYPVEYELGASANLDETRENGAFGMHLGTVGTVVAERILVVENGSGRRRVRILIGSPRPIPGSTD